MTASSNERAAALAALVLGTTPEDEGDEAAPQLKRTGETVYAGGDEARLLIVDAPTLGYMVTGVGYQRVEAVPGDVVTLTKAQAKRLDALGATVDATADPDEVADEVAATGMTDEQIAAMGAADAVAYVGAHPEEADRVRTLELAKRETKRRSSVLDATDPDLIAQAQADADDAHSTGAEEQTNPAAVHGPTASEVAEADQGNDALGAGNN